MIGACVQLRNALVQEYLVRVIVVLQAIWVIDCASWIFSECYWTIKPITQLILSDRLHSWTTPEYLLSQTRRFEWLVCSFWKIHDISIFVLNVQQDLGCLSRRVEFLLDLNSTLLTLLEQWVRYETSRIIGWGTKLGKLYFLEQEGRKEGNLFGLIMAYVGYKHDSW